MAPFTVLVFTKTLLFRHPSIEAGISMFQRLADASTASDHPFVVEASEDSGAVFTPENLARYRVVVLLHCTGVILDAAQLTALEGYVGGGNGGVVGIHASAGAMKSKDVDPKGFYGRLLGAVFTEHSAAQLGRIIIKSPKHPVVSPFLAHVSSFSEASLSEPSFSVFDEWYNFEPTSCAVVASKKTTGTLSTSDPSILLTTDETTYEGGKHGEDHPIAWVWPDFESTGTRVFYTALGHFAESYEDDVFVTHLKNAVLWSAKLL
ncbi:crp fnr family transcriptional regulator [Ophiostoma piceae UAMH 11346]|uniref:Crp fnr family transcriptional regulator n=1 Tax=Ophiostoma piceae (strain UAMH 11346) TaxID=1262450 RepID=S3CC77_OPHP1|nr:crp fnr family transcriptional regulator [Ophiostoma piceae UAMH 11346]